MIKDTIYDVDYLDGQDRYALLSKRELITFRGFLIKQIHFSTIRTFHVVNEMLYQKRLSRHSLDINAMVAFITCKYYLLNPSQYKSDQTAHTIVFSAAQTKCNIRTKRREGGMYISHMNFQRRTWVNPDSYLKEKGKKSNIN